jgi:hypothetical protein
MICCLLLFLLVLLLPSGQHRAAMSTVAILDVIRRKSRESWQTSASYLNCLNLSRGGVLKWRKRRVDKSEPHGKKRKFQKWEEKGFGSWACRLREQRDGHAESNALGRDRVKSSTVA